jgi:hypothetical protein
MKQCEKSIDEFLAVLKFDLEQIEKEMASKGNTECENHFESMAFGFLNGRIKEISRAIRVLGEIVKMER